MGVETGKGWEGETERKGRRSGFRVGGIEDGRTTWYRTEDRTVYRTGQGSRQYLTVKRQDSRKDRTVKRTGQYAGQDS